MQKYKYLAVDLQKHKVKGVYIAKDEDELAEELAKQNLYLVSAKPYVSGETTGLVDMTVPKDTVFVMGDNRETSFDSRNMGAIPCDDLKGKVFFRIYPFGEFGKVK